MRGRWLFAAIFAGVVIAFTIPFGIASLHAPLTQNSAFARTELPITEIRWFNYSPEDSWQPIQFIVPDRNTAKSANGGKLRLYDVHIARCLRFLIFCAIAIGLLRGTIGLMKRKMAILRWDASKLAAISPVP